MANTHSIDLLRELNSKLLAEITELRKENADPISQDFNSIPLDQTNIPSVIDQYVTTQYKSLEDDRETDVFLDDVDKKMVSDKIKQRNREKKIQHESTVPFNLQKLL